MRMLVILWSIYLWVAAIIFIANLSKVVFGDWKDWRVIFKAIPVAIMWPVGMLSAQGRTKLLETIWRTQE